MKKMFFISLTIVLLCPVMINAAELENIKIAVAADGKSAQSSVSNMAAKCPYYLIFNNKGELIEVVDNPHKDASGGAGPSAANFLAQRGITTVIAGNFGSKMVNTLENKSITHFEFKGIADDAVKKVLKLSKSSPALLLRTVRPPSIPDKYSLVGLPARIRSTGKPLQASGLAKLGALGELLQN